MISTPYLARSRARLATAAAAVLTAAAVPALGLGAGTANAASNPDCVTAGTVVTCTFSYNGTDNTNGTAISWTVPANISSLTVTADGASGGNGSNGGLLAGIGGNGGEYQATLTGASLGGTSLSIFPGGQGGPFTGGASDGGSGGAGSNEISPNTETHGGGGGASSVSLGSGPLLLMAGGGGGAGSLPNPVDNNGGTGGGSTNINGANGDSNEIPSALNNGLGGTAIAGGAGGFPGPADVTCLLASAGTALSGGAGSFPIPGLPPFYCSGGAGGGAGYFGGGGSTDDFGGGGGGSAFPSIATITSGVTVTPVADASTNFGNGVVTISYGQAATTTTVTSVTASHHPDLYGTPVTITASVQGSAGTGTMEFDSNGTPITGCTAVPVTAGPGTTYTATCHTTSLPAGRDAITATYSGDASSQGSTSDPVDIAVLTAPVLLTAGHFGGFGNLTLTGTLIAPTGPAVGQQLNFSGPDGVRCSATTGSNGTADCVLTRAQSLTVELNGGHFTVTYPGNGNYGPAQASGHL